MDHIRPRIKRVQIGGHSFVSKKKLSDSRSHFELSPELQAENVFLTLGFGDSQVEGHLLALLAVLLSDKNTYRNV